MIPAAALGRDGNGGAEVFRIHAPLGARPASRRAQRILTGVGEKVSGRIRGLRSGGNPEENSCLDALPTERFEVDYAE